MLKEKEDRAMALGVEMGMRGRLSSPMNTPEETVLPVVVPSLWAAGECARLLSGKTKDNK